MRYQGGKSRISKDISAIITNQSNGGENFVSLFCGSCSVESKVNGYSKKILNDKHEYLIEMFNGVKNGYELPDTVSKEEYLYIKEHKDEDKTLAGFVGFGCSFGGKWFGGYAKSNENTNYASQSKRSLLKDMKGLTNTDFICKDYKEVELPKDCVIYCDPPYNNTTGYGKEKFNTDEFWEYARQISKNHVVFISEQVAPSDFVPVWEKSFTRTLDVNKQNQFKVTEKLFVHESQFQNIKK